jgi:hypothetical protein
MCQQALFELRSVYAFHDDWNGRISEKMFRWIDMLHDLRSFRTG